MRDINRVLQSFGYVAILTQERRTIYDPSFSLTRLTLKVTDLWYDECKVLMVCIKYSGNKC